MYSPGPAKQRFKRISIHVRRFSPQHCSEKVHPGAVLATFLMLIALIFFKPDTLSAQTQWAKHPENPVLRRDTVMAHLPNDIIAISDCWVIKEGALYKMWYTCGGLNYPADTMLRARLCYATSSDGTVWMKYSGNPVLDVSYNGGWDSLGVETASVILDLTAPAAERYKMWYAGQYYNEYRYDIGYAFSADGIQWTKHPSPVLQTGLPAEWDNGFLEGPSVIKEGDTFKMWYCGYDAIADGQATDGRANIGYATSTDGFLWTKHPSNPVMITGQHAWDSIYVQDPHVIKMGGQYHMWFGGGSNDALYDQQVGYATSADGILWNKSTQNPVLERGLAGEWDAAMASFPSVIIDSGEFKMWYTGKDVDPLPLNSLEYFWEVGYATAPLSDMKEAPEDKNRLMISPNPFTILTNIRTGKDLRNARLTVFNSTGQKVRQSENLSGGSITFYGGNLPPGLYYFCLTDDGGEWYGQVIIIE